MSSSSTLGFVLTLFTVVSGCCGYINITDTEDPDSQLTLPLQGRQLGWALDWLSGSGIVGQIIANMLVAVFILPPLGPYICAFLDNCDSLKLRARALLYPSTPRSIRSGREVSEEASRVLESLKAAYDKYT